MAVLAAIAIVMPYRRLPYLFILSTFFDKFMLNYGGINARPSYVIGGVFFAKWVFYDRSRFRHLKENPLVLPMVVLLAANVLASILNAPDPDKSLRLALLSVVFFAPFAALTAILGDRRKYEELLSWYVGLGLASALAGIAAYALFALGGIETVMISPELGGRIVGTQHSAGDHFGIQMCTLFVLGVALVADRGGRRLLGRVPYLKIGVFALAMFLSFKRSAWGGALGGLLVLDLLRRHWGAVLKHAFVAAALVLAAAAAWNLAPASYRGPGSAMDRADQRYQEFLDFSNGTGAARVAGWEAALRLWTEHPIIGSGTGSLDGYQSWISNVFVRALYDSGLVGLVAVVLIWGTLFWKGLRAYARGPSSGTLRACVIGLLAASAALFVVNMVDDEFLLSLFWVQIAFAIAAFTMRGEDDSRTSDANAESLPEAVAHAA
ncbi:MAG: O-antigen ligase family protein [Elusimicrobia bacterium]|nr:O-antigen ligase family protein [Elusimicrobiota bacterium]